MSNSKITLKANFETVEGTIGNLDKWREHDSLLRADILQDWIGLLNREYTIAVAQLGQTRDKDINRLIYELDNINI